MAALTRSDLVAGLRALGLGSGDRVLVHSSLAALGEVEGSADTVIDALLDTLGPEGLLVVPTFATSQPFDRRTSPTPLGAIPDTLWRRPGAFRSKHPTHSVAAMGRGAEELVADHEHAPTAYGEGTPYYKLARSGGKILLLGCDQDRNTTLHTAEALSGAPYLTTVQASYIDDDSSQVAVSVPAMAGPHRDFISLDRLFREGGAMRIGRIGGAVCRLLDTGAMLDLALAALRRDPAAMLCDNPACADCVMQRGKIKAARLGAEDFTLAAVATEVGEDLATIAGTLQAEGIVGLELTLAEYERYANDSEALRVSVVAVRGKVEDTEGAALSRRLGVPMIVPVGDEASWEGAMGLGRTGTTVYMENSGAPSSFFENMYERYPEAPGLAFNPGAFAAEGEKPFLEVFYRGRLRRHIVHVYLEDRLWEAEPAWPGRGNGEVKEILSMLRCRSFRGVITLRSPAPLHFRECAAAFWHLLDTM